MIRCSRSRRTLVLFIVMVWPAGCTVFEPSPQELCDRLLVGGQVQEEVLSELLRAPHRTEKVMALFAGWGRRSQEYDEVIVSKVIEDSDHTDADVLNAMKARLREEPLLFCQIRQVRLEAAVRAREFIKDAPTLPPSVYYSQGKLPSAELKTNSPWLMDCVYDSLFRLAPETDSVKISSLISLAADFNRPELILNLSMANLNEQWTTEKEWLRENARYVYFDEQSGLYVLDEDAARRKEPVAPERQQPRGKTGGA